MAEQKIADSISKVKEFIQLWMKFNQMYKEAMSKSSITPESEQSFLDTKSVIARKFQTLVDSMPIDRMTIDRTYDMINQILSLRTISTLSEEALRKINSEWHGSYISLNRLLGHLEAQKEHATTDAISGIKRLWKGFWGLLAYTMVIMLFLAVIIYIIHIINVIK